MATDLTNKRASKLAAYIVGISLVPIATGAIMVNAPVIAIGALGVALAAVVKLRGEPKEQTPIYTPTNNPARRAEDQKPEQIGAAH
jgi:hypothetical protein